MADLIFSDKYVVQEEIAKGGMGVLYRALDRTLNRVVAIKLVHAHLTSDPSFAERFLREARAMARLHHENIVTIFSVEHDRDTQFLVMEYFPGMNLRSLIRQHTRLPLREAVTIALQLAHALAYAHAHGIVHRDIKPANILVGPQSKTKLTDFGIAAALDEISITSPGQVIGTPEYMAPEQARGLKLDGRSDLYALGIVFYELLTGNTPYRDIPKTAILGKLMSERHDLRLEFPSDVPSYLHSLIRELTHLNPADRLESAEVLATQLTEILYSLPAVKPGVLQATEPAPTVIVPSPTIQSAHEVSPEFDRTLAQSHPASSPTRPLSVQDPTILSSTPLREAEASEFIQPTRHTDRPREPVSAVRTPSPPEPRLHQPEPSLTRRHVLAVASVLALALALGIIGYSLLPPLDRGSTRENRSQTERDGLSSEHTKQLHSLLDQFRQAYEQRDLSRLQALSRMSEARQRNIQLMFASYTTFRVSLKILSETAEGATAVLTLNSAAKVDGEIVDLPPLAKTIRVTISREGADWGKVIW
jgi:serine/threonine-protein kinase